MLAGVPFGPSYSFLKDMHAGVTNGGLNKKHLSPQVYYTHPCYYAYFPVFPDTRVRDDGSQYPDGSKLMTLSKEVLDFNCTDVAEWEKYGLLLSNLSTITDKERKHLQTCLNNAKQLKEEQIPKHESYPPVAVLAGNAFDTR